MEPMRERHIVRRCPWVNLSKPDYIEYHHANQSV